MNRQIFVSLSLSLALALAMALPGNAMGAPPRDDEATTQRLFHEGVARFRAGDVDRACDLFQKSYDEASQPGALYNLALCREAQGRHADAYRDFEDLATRAALIPAEATQAATLRATADRLIPKLARVDLVHRSDAVSDVTRVTVDGVVTPIDGWKRPIYVMPGTHVLVVTHADASVVTRTTKALVAGDVATIETEDPLPLPDTPMGPLADGPLTRSPVHDAFDSGRRRAATITVAGGVALVGAGLVLGAVALGDRNSADSLCGGDRTACAPSEVSAATSRLSTSRELATFSTIGVAAGGAALAVATYLFFTSRERTPSRIAVAPVLTPYATPSGAGVGFESTF